MLNKLLERAIFFYCTLTDHGALARPLVILIHHTRVSSRHYYHWTRNRALTGTHEKCRKVCGHDIKDDFQHCLRA